VTAKITGPAVAEPLPRDHGAARDLDRVVSLVDSGDWTAIAAALSRWQERTQSLLERARDVEAGNRAPLERRAELRGLLDAFHAKAAHLGLLEEPELAARYGEARAVLFTAPTDLELAARLVRRYQEGLRDPREVAT
jgi:hypothetical protein